MINVSIIYLSDKHHDKLKICNPRFSVEVEAPVFVSTQKRKSINAYSLNPVLIYLRVSKVEIQWS